MPLYQYKCECGKSWEELLDYHQAASAMQCVCGKLAPQVFSSFAFKIDNYSPSNVDAEAEFHRMGID